MTVSMTAIALTVCLGAGGFPSAPDGFLLGPVAPDLDLRNMVRAHIVRRACELLGAAAERRTEAFSSGTWQTWRAEIRQKVRAALGEMSFGPSGPPLNVRAVSRHERPGYVIENVLFESLPGWDVNASVYLPIAKEHPPPWPAIVVPVGHSGKQMESYQIPAQVFARCGYVALTFDPPGMAGEKQGGNDHFSDGVRCYLTGQSSNRYFVIDALRCVDYLETRDDVDMARGVGMTGVSGGGTTTMFATILDERIRASGPSCCATPNALHPVKDVYAPCAETLAAGRFADGYDDVDLLAAAAPTPVLLMAGTEDEVFKAAWSSQVAQEAGAAFSQAGLEDRFAYFADPGGHAYTATMALEFVKWMDRWVRDTPDRAIPELGRDDFEMDKPELLKCGPRLDRNMFSVNRDRALELASNRPGSPGREGAAKVAHIAVPVPVPGARTGPPTLAWFHYVEEILLRPDTDIELPATFLYPARDGWRGPAVLYFDDRGRWTDLRANGPLARMTRFIDKETDGPAVLTIDLRGWGDSRPADTPYDLAGWADRSRWISYVSAALGDHILAMRIRDGLAALAYLRSREETGGAIIAGGRGMGGVVALHVAAIDGKLAGAFSAEGLASFESLATSARYMWSHEDFLPGVLLHYDLPDLVRALTMPSLIVNPLGPGKEPLDKDTTEALYTAADGLELHANVDAARAEDLIRKFVLRFARP